MNVYVESNFVLELALLQEQQESCKGILALCEKGQASLVFPAFSIAEPYDTLVRRAKARERLRDDLNTELGQLSRSISYREEIQALSNIVGLLTRSEEEEKQRLHSALDQILRLAEVIPTEARTISSAAQLQLSFDLSPQDSVVYASVLQHLDGSERKESCFLNRNAKDFNDPGILATLERYRCKFLPRFDAGLQYIRSRLD